MAERVTKKAFSEVRQLPEGRIPPEFFECVELARTRHEDVHHNIDEVDDDPARTAIPIGVPGPDVLSLEFVGDVVGHGSCLDFGID